MGIAIYRHGKSLLFKVIGIALPVVMFASIVLTANHYIIDGLAGGMLAILGLAGAAAIHQYLNRRSEESGTLASQHT